MEKEKVYKCLLCNRPIKKHYTILYNNSKDLKILAYVGNNCLSYNDSGIYTAFYDVKKDKISNREKILKF